ncbi:hypothetical protein CAPTEDRAFT_150888 [Capitella teleta]|uniref:ATP synthase peripheral stalk subunit OSCP, mitochondrial n=1 Tax=Capitella teleta TaxID=283909 RepID=R7UBL3_CAPTE|nr:hypothetical protein CAPTEDRAFT_150888 [Capitella teleta]|eukprot:ELU03374.1 hypothetical protein CAPTEDRAFT_150888 [Capitella teleta]
MAAPRITGVVRQLSTSASRSHLVQAPIQLFGVEGRYAHALYSAATKQKSLQSVEKELNSFKDILKVDTKFNQFVKDPTIKRGTKSEVLLASLQKQKFSPITTNFLCAMAENGRLGKVTGIISAFDQIMAAFRGDVICSVTTAKAMDAKTQKDVEATVKLFLKKGENLLLTSKVDPALIGGMVVEIGDRFVDLSIASKVKKYSSVITEAI